MGGRGSRDQSEGLGRLGANARVRIGETLGQCGHGLSDPHGPQSLRGQAPAVGPGVLEVRDQLIREPGRVDRLSDRFPNGRVGPAGRLGEGVHLAELGQDHGGAAAAGGDRQLAPQRRDEGVASALGEGLTNPPPDLLRGILDGGQ